MQQQWNGSELALQLLVLPASSSDPLPKYADSASYLKPQHCRLCLQEVDDLEKHLRDSQGDEVHANASCLQTYREKVFRHVVEEWPQAISPQVLRSRLAAFKEAMKDQNFGTFACASCARQK